MKKLFILMVCLVAIGFAAEMIPAYIPASAIHREVLPATIEIKAECVYTGITNYPPWLEHGRDAPWGTDVRIDDAFDLDDQLLSMAEDANGRIYVCYEGVYDDPPGPNVDIGMGIATSVDNGQTWDNRVWGSSGIDVRYCEIAISDDGKIWVYGSLQGTGYDDEVVWMKSIDGSFNDPDQLEGLFWLGGTIDFRTYPEVITWGNNNQLVLSTWTFYDGSENVVAWIYATDGGAGGSWSIFSLAGDTEPDGMTSIGVNYDGANYIAVHGWEEDIGGGDWNVMCMIDTLETGTGLSGWGTTNTDADRYPSVFCSNGYAYIAYQGDDGGGDNDIMFNYSTDYGENWASIVDLTNDTSNETYPRLYGDDQEIGVDYVYGNNRVRFNYSIDNGITWLGTPEQINEGTTVNSNYHSVALLHTSSYWHAAWEDTRNSGTDGLEIYTSRRNIGQGDITHRPEILTFNYDFAFSGGYYVNKYVTYHIPEPIDSKLADEIRMSSENDLIPIFIMLAKQLNYEYLVPRAQQMSKPERRRFVIDECQELANEDQQVLLSYLRQKEVEGKVRDILSLWSTNTIALSATAGVIHEIAQRQDIWEIGMQEKTEFVDVEQRDEHEYLNVNFVPDDGREICWGVAKIRADDVWNDLGYTGAGVLVGHMDSGVNYNHTDLSSHMWDGSGAGYPNHGYDFVNEDDDPIDDNGHGTHTAGIVAGDGTSGSNTGVAPNAIIMVLKCDSTNIDMQDAIQFGLTHNVDLFSSSLGFENPGSSIKNWGRGQANSIYAAGLVWCNAAGNGRSVPPYGHYSVPQDIIAPADVPSPYYAPNGENSASIAVGATDGDDNVASWSSYGPTEWDTGTWSDYPYPPGLMKPDVAAPGVNCKSLDHLVNNAYDTGINGTSFAQPHVAGTVCLMLERNPGLTPTQIDSILQTTAFDIEGPGRDTLSGEGRIDAYQAVQAISEGIKWAQLWVINQASATGILDVTGITQDENQPWIVSVNPTQFTVPIDDSQAVWVTTDTIGIGLTWGQWYYDTLLVWSNSIFDDNPERVPVILIMATVGIEEDEYLTPRANANLLSILPNPFTTSVKIDYAIPCAQDVNFTIYDVCGKKVKTFVDGYQEPGQFSVTWTGCDEKGRKLAAGIYFGRIELGKHAVTNKLILIR